MGKKRSAKTKIDIILSKKDDASDIQQQWDGLKSEFSHSSSALLFHLKNHYALIFALREWVGADGVHMKQLLTSRRGQRPSAWVDFEEARETMLGWEGYKIMALSCTVDQREIKDAKLSLSQSGMLDTDFSALYWYASAPPGVFNMAFTEQQRILKTQAAKENCR